MDKFFSQCRRGSVTGVHDEKRRQMYYNKGIAKIEYNSLNLPKKMQFKPGHILQYGYDASGTKRIEEESTAIAGLTVPMEEFTQVSLLNYSRRDYCGNVVYGGNGGGYVSYLYTPEGYARRANITSGDWIYYYTLKDHLGSVRSEFKGDGTNVGYTHYYPSGIEITDPGYSQSLQSQERYNGKEFQSMFGLNMNDYGKRFYDGPSTRWWTPDPLAEIYYSISPYVYCSNNPVRNIDPTGMFVLPSYTDDELKNLGLTREDLTRFTSVVTNISNLLNDNPDALDAIINTTGLSAETIMNDFTFGEGPTVSIGNPFGVGAQGGKDGITISSEIVKNLASISTDDTNSLATQTLGTAMTLFHEYGHYGDQVTNNGNNSGQFNPNTGESDVSFYKNSMTNNNNIEKGTQNWSITKTGHRGDDITMSGFGVSFSVGGNGQFSKSKGSFSKLPYGAKLNNVLRTLKVR